MLYSNALAYELQLGNNRFKSVLQVKSYFPTVTSASGIANAASPIAVISTPDGDSLEEQVVVSTVSLRNSALPISLR